MTGRAVTAKTPGQAACAAWWATAEGVPSPPDVTYDQDAKAWEASAQAAIKASGLAKTPEQVGEIAGYVSGQIARELLAERDRLRDQLADAVNPAAADYDHAAEIMRLRDELAKVRAELAAAEPVAVVASRDSVAPELAAAMAETRQLRELAAEILATFGPSGSGHTARRPGPDRQMAAARGTGRRERDVTVDELTPGDLVTSGGMSAVFITRSAHPVYPGLALVVWQLSEGGWSLEALSFRQEVGDVTPSTSTERGVRLYAAFGSMLTPAEAAQ